MAQFLMFLIEFDIYFQGQILYTIILLIIRQITFQYPLQYGYELW